MKLLIAVDENKSGKKIIDFCHEYINSSKLEVYLTTVIPSLNAYSSLAMLSDVVGTMRDSSRENAEQLLTTLSRYLKAYNKCYQIDTTVIEGLPAEGIVARGDELEADLIVVGSHNKHGLKKLLLGSVSQAVMSQSTRSVLVCNLSQCVKPNPKTPPVKQKGSAILYKCEGICDGKNQGRSERLGGQLCASHSPSQSHSVEPSRKRAMVGYLRQGKDSITVAEQYQILLDFCQSNDFYLKAFFTDYFRPGLGLKTARAAMRECDGLIASNLNCFVEHEDDRLRDLRPFIHNFFTHPERRLVSVEEGIDTGSAMGQSSAMAIIGQTREFV